MPSYESIIANKIPDLSVGFDGMMVYEKTETEDAPYRFNYKIGAEILARLSVEIKDRQYPQYFLSWSRVAYAKMHPEYECYVAYYLTNIDRLILFNVSACNMVQTNMSKVFHNFKGLVDSPIFIIKPVDACLDMEIKLW